MRIRMYECDHCHAVVDERGYEGLAGADPNAPLTLPHVQAHISTIKLTEIEKHGANWVDTSDPPKFDSKWGDEVVSGIHYMYCGLECRAHLLRAVADALLQAAKNEKIKPKQHESDPALLSAKDRYEKFRNGSIMK